ncbi:hypothetical protein [Actinoplanes sp. NPDC026670]|uniref:DUF6907 domain-containing protein n=1 Tax=Actinoplanes sp. NPDC026670 TaxID=3154700 RepID=UPI0033C9815F
MPIPVPTSGCPEWCVFEHDDPIQLEQQVGVQYHCGLRAQIAAASPDDEPDVYIEVVRIDSLRAGTVGEVRVDVGCVKDDDGTVSLDRAERVRSDDPGGRPQCPAGGDGMKSTVSTTSALSGALVAPCPAWCEVQHNPDDFGFGEGAPRPSWEARTGQRHHYGHTAVVAGTDEEETVAQAEVVRVDERGVPREIGVTAWCEAAMTVEQAERFAAVVSSVATKARQLRALEH